MTDVFNADTDTDCVILLIMTTDTDTALRLRGVCEMSVVTWPDQLTILTRWPRLHSHQPHPPPTPAAHFRPWPNLKWKTQTNFPWPSLTLLFCRSSNIHLGKHHHTVTISADVIGDHPLVLAWAQSLARAASSDSREPQSSNLSRLPATVRGRSSVSDHKGKFQTLSSNWHPQMITLSANRFH